MVHHFCLFRPFRTLFGLMLMLGAIACLYQAVRVERPRAARWQHEPSQQRRYYAPIDAPGASDPREIETVAAPVPKPPAPAADKPSARPDWIDKPGHLESQGGVDVYVTTATAGPYSSDEECDRALGAEIDRAVAEYAEKEFPRPAEGTVKLDADLVQKHLIQDRYRETVNTESFGPMKQEHAMLVFDRKIRSAIEHQWRAITVEKRLQIAAIGSGAVLLLLGGVYSLLRLKPAAR